MSVLLNYDPSKFIKSLVLELKDLYDQADVNPIIAKLQSMGYNLCDIQKNGYGMIGVFRHECFNKEFHIPYYEIDEDISVQINNMFEEYCIYRLEILNSEIQNAEKYRLMNFNIDFEVIDWNKIYNSREYISLFLEVTTELLYSRLNDYLTKDQRLELPSFS